MSDNSGPIRVMTVDDHEIMRTGVRFMLLAFDDLKLIGEAKRGDEAVRLCQEVKPDVVLVDMKMPGMDGLQTTTEIKSSCPHVQVLILTSFHDTKLVRGAMRAGAAGYLLKDTTKEDLAAAIRAATIGKTTICQEATKDLLTDPVNAIVLTDRERDVLLYLSKGMSNKEIGKQLHRSPFTVRHHVSQLIKKLGASNRAEVAAIAVERGLLP